MTTLIDQIKNDRLHARKNKQAIHVSVLTTLEGEAVAFGKNNGNRAPTDEEVCKIIKKFIKNQRELQSNLSENDERYVVSGLEIEILTQYLPTQLTRDQLHEIITSNFPQITHVGKVMGFLSKNYTDRFDGIMAKQILQSMLIKDSKYRIDVEKDSK